MIVNLPGEGRRGFQSHSIALSSYLSYPLPCTDCIVFQTAGKSKKTELSPSHDCTGLCHTTNKQTHRQQTHRQQTHGQTMSKKDYCRHKGIPFHLPFSLPSSFPTHCTSPLGDHIIPFSLLRQLQRLLTIQLPQL